MSPGRSVLLLPWVGRRVGARVGARRARGGGAVGDRRSVDGPGRLRRLVGARGGGRSPLVVMVGCRPRGRLEGGQVGPCHVEVVDGAGITQLDEPGRQPRRPAPRRAARAAGTGPGRGAPPGGRRAPAPASPPRPRNAGRRIAVAVGPVRLDERRHGLRVDPAHPGRPDERRIGAVDLRPRDVDPAADLPDRAGLHGRRGGEDGGRSGERIGDRAVGIERDDDDREARRRPRRCRRAGGRWALPRRRGGRTPAGRRG